MQKKNITIRILFILYSIIMLWLLYGQRLDTVSYGNYFGQLKENINLIPFRTVAEYIGVYNSSGNAYLVEHAYINLAGNVAVFIPLGVFLPALWNKLKSFKKFLLCNTVIIILIEIVQYFSLLGSLDIDDFILNMIGVSVGFLVYKLVSKISH